MRSGTKEQYNSAPVVNWKCIVFTMVLVLGYWFAPPKNKYILGALLYFPYIIMAWYDYYYICERNLGPTYLALFYWWAKPPSSRQVQDYNNWDPAIKRKVLIIDLLLLGGILAFVPLFLRWSPQ